MVSITSNGKIIATSDAPTYIKLNPANNTYIICDKHEAQGVAANSTPYSLNGGLTGCPEAEIVDAAYAMAEMADNDALTLMEAVTDLAEQVADLQERIGGNNA